MTEKGTSFVREHAQRVHCWEPPEVPFAQGCCKPRLRKETDPNPVHVKAVRVRGDSSPGAWTRTETPQDRNANHTSQQTTLPPDQLLRLQLQQLQQRQLLQHHLQQQQQQQQQHRLKQQQLLRLQQQLVAQPNNAGLHREQQQSLLQLQQQQQLLLLQLQQQQSKRLVEAGETGKADSLPNSLIQISSSATAAALTPKALEAMPVDEDTSALDALNTELADEDIDLMVAELIGAEKLRRDIHELHNRLVPHWQDSGLSSSNYHLMDQHLSRQHMPFELDAMSTASTFHSMSPWPFDHQG